MSVKRVVKQGDCISSIAFEHGFFPGSLWDHPENADLKKLRGDPHVLLEGDVVHVPDREEKTVSADTGRTHTFKRRGVPEVLRIRFTDRDGKPRAGVPYRLELGGATITGETSGDGMLAEYIPPDAVQAKLTLGEGDEQRVIDLALGHLDPITTLRGVEERLRCLGFQPGKAGELDALTREAIRAFQAAHDIDPTGEPDDPTRDKIETVYRCKG